MKYINNPVKINKLEKIIATLGDYFIMSSKEEIFKDIPSGGYFDGTYYYMKINDNAAKVRLNYKNYAVFKGTDFYNNKLLIIIDSKKLYPSWRKINKRKRYTFEQDMKKLEKIKPLIKVNVKETPTIFKEVHPDYSDIKEILNKYKSGEELERKINIKLY